MSQDGTRSIIEEMAQRDKRIRNIDNPCKTKPFAFNDGILVADGQYVAILGAHSEYALDYLRVCIDILREHADVGCAGAQLSARARLCSARQ